MFWVGKESCIWVFFLCMFVIVSNLWSYLKVWWVCYVYDGCYGNILKCEIVDVIIVVVVDYVNFCLIFYFISEW